MKRVIVSYRIKPEHIEENGRLIEAVFAELSTSRPEGLRYMSFRGEGGRFVHIAERAEGAADLPEFDSFRKFQKSFAERCLVRPDVTSIEIVGSYGMGGEQPPPAAVRGQRGGAL